MSTIYGTMSDADAYFSSRGTAAWAAETDAALDAALVRASSYIDGRYRSRFPGRKTGGRSQEREWPRTAAIDGAGNSIASDEIPSEIIQATFEAALRELQSPNSLSPDVVAGRLIKRESKTVGPIEKEVEYADASGAAAMRPVVFVIDDLLAGLLLPIRSASSSANYLLRA